MHIFLCLSFPVRKHICFFAPILKRLSWILYPDFPISCKMDGPFLSAFWLSLFKTTGVWVFFLMWTGCNLFLQTLPSSCAKSVILDTCGQRSGCFCQQEPLASCVVKVLKTLSAWTGGSELQLTLKHCYLKNEFN